VRWARKAARISGSTGRWSMVQAICLSGTPRGWSTTDRERGPSRKVRQAGARSRDSAAVGITRFA
jgi:hypothetical protein